MVGINRVNVYQPQLAISVKCHKSNNTRLKKYVNLFFMISALYSINSIDDKEKKDEVETTTKHQN